MKQIFNIIAVLLTFPGTSLLAQNEVVTERLNEISKNLDTSIFVGRFKSIESPCLCIDPENNSFAYPKRNYINSDYRIQLKNGSVDSNGVKCLSEHIARYLDFQVDSIDFNSQFISGRVAITYGYPASSLIQFLGLTLEAPNKNMALFDKLISLRGKFSMYTEVDKYRIKMSFCEGPFDERDAYLGHLEVVKHAFEKNAPNVYILTFDQMSIHKGDANNQIEEKFTSTTHADEMEYYAFLAYSVLNLTHSKDFKQRAQALWLDNFLNNPQCMPCKKIYEMAKALMSRPKFSLPNTSPNPAH
jgi:hypothetical protein